MNEPNQPSTPTKVARRGQFVTFNWSTVGRVELYLESGAFFDSTYDRSVDKTLDQAVRSAVARGFRIYVEKAAQLTHVALEELPDGPPEAVDQFDLYATVARIVEEA